MSRWFRRARQPRVRRRICGCAIAGCFWSSCIRARARRGCLTRPSGRGLVLRRGLPAPPGGGASDNMTTAPQTLCIGTARAHNRHCLERCSRPRDAPVACTPGAGWKKGQGGRTQWGTPAAACSCPGRAARRTPRSPPGLVKRAAPRPRREPGIPDVGTVTRHGFRKSSPMGGGRQWLPADSCYSIDI